MICPADYGRRTHSKITIDRVPSRKFIHGGAIMERIYDICYGTDVHKNLSSPVSKTDVKDAE